MGIQRQITRRNARQLYDKFSKMWRRDARLAEVYGKSGTSKPRFHQWWKMHQEQLAKMKNGSATGAQIQQAMEDPWAEVQMEAAPEVSVEPEERGVLSVPIGDINLSSIMGGKDDDE